MEEYVDVVIGQKVAILVDGNNIEKSIHSATKNQNTMLNFDTLIPNLDHFLHR